MAESKDFYHLVSGHLWEKMREVIHPSLYRRILGEIGADLGQKAVAQIQDTRHPQPLDQDTFLRRLEWLKMNWGWNHEVRVETKRRILIVIPSCPFRNVAVGDPNICQVVAGIIGGMAQGFGEYAKISTCRGPSGLPTACRLTVHLERTPQSLVEEGTSFPLAVTNNQEPPRKQHFEAQMVSQLSIRHQQVLRLVGEGLSDKEIADALNLSIRTVQGHISRIREKTNLGSRSALIRLGLVSGYAK